MGKIEGRNIFIVSPGFLEKENISFEGRFEQLAKKENHNICSGGKTLLSYVALADKIRNPPKKPLIS